MPSMGTGWLPTSASSASTSLPKLFVLSERNRTPVNRISCGSDVDIVVLLIVNVGLWRAIDEQAEQFRAAVVAAGVHLRLALVDQREVKVCDHLAFAETDWLPEQFAHRRDDCGE